MRTRAAAVPTYAEAAKFLKTDPDRQLFVRSSRPHGVSLSSKTSEGAYMVDVDTSQHDVEPRDFERAALPFFGQFVIYCLRVQGAALSVVREHKDPRTDHLR